MTLYRKHAPYPGSIKNICDFKIKMEHKNWVYRLPFERKYWASLCFWQNGLLGWLIFNHSLVRNGWLLVKYQLDFTKAENENQYLTDLTNDIIF